MKTILKCKFKYIPEKLNWCMSQKLKHPFIHCPRLSNALPTETGPSDFRKMTATVLKTSLQKIQPKIIEL